MAGRPRRARLLFGIVVFVTIVYLYMRHSTNSYDEWVAETIGGGAVLRPDKPQEHIPAHNQPPHPPLQSEHKVYVPSADLPHSKWKPISTPTQWIAQPSISSSAPTAPLRQGHPHKEGEMTIIDSHNLPYEHGEGRVEVQMPTVVPTTSNPGLHWSKMPEHFPVTSTRQLPTESPKAIPRIQYRGKMPPEFDRLASVKGAAEHAWEGYRTHAFGSDELSPVSGTKKNPFNGWGATLVDSLDTLWIMGMTAEFESALKLVEKIDFTTSRRSDIPLFETTIRYLGGLVGAYDISGHKYRSLLDKAVELAEVLYAAFDTPNRMPQLYYHWRPSYASQPHRAQSRVVLAELGSLSVEFTRLAQLTGEPKYYDAIARITDALEEFQNKTRLPGMWPISIDASGCKVPSTYGKVAQNPPPKQPNAKPGLAKLKTVEDYTSEDDLQEPQQEQILGAGRPGIGKISGWNDPAGYDDTKKSRPDNEKISAKPQKQPSIGKIAGFGDPILEGSLDSKQAKNELLQELTYKNQKRSPPPADIMPDIDTCIPQGLISAGWGDKFTLGGQSDSTYEYLPKEYLLLGGNVDQYRTMYLAHVDPAVKYLFYRPMTPGDHDILMSGTFHVSVNRTDNSLVKTYQAKNEHLTCFAGGMFAMGGKIFDRPQDVEIGRKLTEGCVWAYNVTATGIMPEMFTFIPCEDPTKCPWDQAKYWKELDPAAESRLRGSTSNGLQHLTSLAEAQEEPMSLSFDPAPDYPVQKRQFDMPVNDGARAPAPAPLPLPDLPLKYDDGTGPLRPHHGPAQPAQPAYTPPAPLTHEEFVMQKIADERLPDGMVMVDSRHYILRPEAIESVFYMYRITGDQYWRDIGWQMFKAVDQHTRTLYGHSAIDDVTKRAPEFEDSMESFWLAETLKYFYLLFDEGSTWSLDDWVLNTEAHFLRRPDAASP